MKHLLPPLMALAFLVGTALSVSAFNTEVHVVNRRYIPEGQIYVHAAYSVPVAGGEVTVRDQVLAMLADEEIDTVKADRIIHCESSWRPTAYNENRNGSNDAGLFQINSIHGLSVEDRMDVEKSTQFAIKLIKAQGWIPWVCK